MTHTSDRRALWLPLCPFGSDSSQPQLQDRRAGTADQLSPRNHDTGTLARPAAGPPSPPWCAGRRGSPAGRPKRAPGPGAPGPGAPGPGAPGPGAPGPGSRSPGPGTSSRSRSSRSRSSRSRSPATGAPATWSSRDRSSRYRSSRYRSSRYRSSRYRSSRYRSSRYRSSRYRSSRYRSSLGRVRPARHVAGRRAGCPTPFHGCPAVYVPKIDGRRVRSGRLRGAGARVRYDVRVAAPSAVRRWRPDLGPLLWHRHRVPRVGCRIEWNRTPGCARSVGPAGAATVGPPRPFRAADPGAAVSGSSRGRRRAARSSTQPNASTAPPVMASAVARSTGSVRWPTSSRASRVEHRPHRVDGDVVPQVDGHRPGVEQRDRAVQRPDPAEPVHRRLPAQHQQHERERPQRLRLGDVVEVDPSSPAWPRSQ